MLDDCTLFFSIPQALFVTADRGGIGPSMGTDNFRTSNSTLGIGFEVVACNQRFKPGVLD